jgi:hypothetical protein
VRSPLRLRSGEPALITLQSAAEVTPEHPDPVRIRSEELAAVPVHHEIHYLLAASATAEAAAIAACAWLIAATELDDSAAAVLYHAARQRSPV